MVNENEKKVLEKYEKEGWRVIRGGPPDFLMLKVNNGEIADHQFVEVKTPDSELTYEQAIYKRVLEMLGANYVVEVVPSRSSPSQTSPTYARLDQSKPTARVPSSPSHAIPVQSNPPQTIPVHPMPDHPTPDQLQTNSKEVKIYERDES